MNTKDELIKILVNNAQSWNKEETQDRAFIYVDDFLNEVESKFKLLPIPDVTNRTFRCNRCGTVYTLTEGTHIGCCTMPTEHRTSGICGGELIEVVI